MINYDIYSNIPMGFCSGNATDGPRKPTINPIIKCLVGSNPCGAFLFSGPSAYIPSQAAYKKEDRENTHNLTKSGPSVLFHGLVSPIRSLLKGA